MGGTASAWTMGDFSAFFISLASFHQKQCSQLRGYYKEERDASSASCLFPADMGWINSCFDTKLPHPLYQIPGHVLLLSSWDVFTFTLTALSEVGAHSPPADKQPGLQRSPACTRLPFGEHPAAHSQFEGLHGTRRHDIWATTASSAVPSIVVRYQ